MTEQLFGVMHTPRPIPIIKVILGFVCLLAALLLVGNAIARFAEVWPWQIKRLTTLGVASVCVTFGLEMAAVGVFLISRRHSAISKRAKVLAVVSMFAAIFLAGAVVRANVRASRYEYRMRQAAEQGDAHAQWVLGDYYEHGYGGTEDLVEAIKWYRKAAEQGYADAQFHLGCCYDDGTGVTKDHVEAVKWFRKVAEHGDAAAQWLLGYYYENGDGVTKDLVEAIKWYRKAAEQGIEGVRLQYKLGWYYANGYGVPTDYVEAGKWWRKAGEQGYAAAQEALGECYDNGYGVTKDTVEAVRWWRKAADQGDADAQLRLGACYLNGDGVKKDTVEAAKWFCRAADQGLAGAQNNLGFCYYHGEGLTEDAVEAVKWFRKAADQELAGAQRNLGLCYYTGDGVTKDAVEAARWYRKAAEQGHAVAQLALGSCYMTGDGVTKDYVEAYRWTSLALAQGDESARQNLSWVEPLMTPEQIAEAQRLARGFKPSKPPEPGASFSSGAVADSSPGASGTGFFITDNGFLVTSEHVVKDAAQIRLVTSTGLIAAKVMKLDAANDLALLKAEGKFAALPVATSRAARLGNTVATVGFPNIGLQGFAPKFAKGEIAALSGVQDDPRCFQISVPVQPGNSGGALVDERGNVVGVVSAKLNVAAAVATSGALPENVNYAVKSSFLLSFLESVPEVSVRLKQPNTGERKFEEVVKSAQDAAVLVLVY